MSSGRSERVIQHPVFLPDTEVELTLVGTEPHRGRPSHRAPRQLPAAAADRVDRTFVARWTLREAITLEIQLTSRATSLTSKPAFFSIGLLKDRGAAGRAARALGVGAHVTPIATIPPLPQRDRRPRSLDDPAAARANDGGERKRPSRRPRRRRCLSRWPPTAAVRCSTTRPGTTSSSRPIRRLLGTILRFVAEAEDKCARGLQVGRSAALQMQVVPADELFYEILIRRRAERAKFVTLYEAAEKRAASLSRSPTPDDYANGDARA